MNAAYFLPLVYRIWFIEAPPEARPVEAPAMLIGPAVVTALASLSAGVLAGAGISPLGWATLIADREYLP